MKLIWGIAGGLVAGVALGWIGGYVHPNRKAVRQVKRYVERLLREQEPDGTTAALCSIKGIQLISAGMTNEAMEALSHPLARYYRTYASDPGTNQYRQRMREVIEELARTNQIVRASLNREPLEGMVPVWMESAEDYAWVGIITDSSSRGEPDAAHEPPPAAAVGESSGTVYTNLQSETPADGSGR